MLPRVICMPIGLKISEAVGLYCVAGGHYRAAGSLLAAVGVVASPDRAPLRPAAAFGSVHDHPVRSDRDQRQCAGSAIEAHRPAPLALHFLRRHVGQALFHIGPEMGPLLACKLGAARRPPFGLFVVARLRGPAMIAPFPPLGGKEHVVDQVGIAPPSAGGAFASPMLLNRCKPRAAALRRGTGRGLAPAAIWTSACLATHVDFTDLIGIILLGIDTEQHLEAGNNARGI